MGLEKVQYSGLTPLYSKLCLWCEDGVPCPSQQRSAKTVSPPARSGEPAPRAHTPTGAANGIPTGRKSEVDGVQPPKVYGKRGPGSSLTGVSIVTRDKSPSDSCGDAVQLKANPKRCNDGIARDGLSVREVAAKLGVSRGTVLNDEHSALKKLRQVLDPRNPKPKTIKRNPRKPPWVQHRAGWLNTESLAEVDAEAQI